MLSGVVQKLGWVDLNVFINGLEEWLNSTLMKSQEDIKVRSTETINRTKKGSKKGLMGGSMDNK